MTKENEEFKNENNSFIQELTNEEAFQKGLLMGIEKGRKIGQVEGMIAYQKRLVENLQKDNASFNQKLAEIY